MAKDLLPPNSTIAVRALRSAGGEDGIDGDDGDGERRRDEAGRQRRRSGYGTATTTKEAVSTVLKGRGLVGNYILRPIIEVVDG